MRIDSTDATNNIAVKTVSSPESNNSESSKASKSTSSVEEFYHLTSSEKHELPISDRVVLEAIERANKAVSMAGRTFEYSIHEKTKQIMIKVIDSDTKEVIREIPPEKTLDMVAKMMEMAGLLVDERR